MAVEWMTEASCASGDGAGVDFFSEDPGEVGKALSVCSGCPVRRQCLESSLEGVEVWGVWGGTMAGERMEALNVRQDGRIGNGSGSRECLGCGAGGVNVDVVGVDRLWTHLQCGVCGLEWNSRTPVNIVVV